VSGDGVVDQVDQDFQGTIVETRGDKFYVNGERFIFKGLNFAYPDDFDAMRWIGFNGIRVDRDDHANASYPTWIVGPSPSDVEQGLEQGIVFAPLVGFDSVAYITDVYDRPDSPYNEMEIQLQVLAMRNDPNVIIWNMANEMFADALGAERNVTQMELYLKTRYEAAHALDPYHRPVSYSNIFWQYYTFWQDIVGTNVYGSSPYVSADKPLFMTEWGMGLIFLKGSWNQVILDDDWGVMGGVLWPGGAPSGPGSGYPLGDIGINYADPAKQDAFRWGLREALQDMAIRVQNTSSDEMVISLVNRRFFAMEDIVVSIHLVTTGEMILREVERIAPYETVNITIGGMRSQPVEVEADYETHGGLKAFSNLSTLMSHDHAYPRETTAKAKYFRYGMSFIVNLTEPCYWNVTVVDPNGVAIDFVSDMGDSISITWNVTDQVGELTPGWYTFVLDLMDLAGNQPPPVNRYRYPLPEPVGIALLAPALSWVALVSVQRRGRDSRSPAS
jgi:hypothetical protein